MGFEEFFDQDSRRSRQADENHYRQNDHYRQDDPYRHDDHDRQNEYSESSHAYQPHNDMKQQFLNKLRDNPQLKTLIIVGAVIVLIIIVVAAIFLIPLILKILGYVGDNGIQGVINSIWKGAK
jgi:hypothetical protein